MNRPGGDNNLIINNRPGGNYWGGGHHGGGYWGGGDWGHGHWSNDWHDYYVHHHHHGWYHGCWNGHWGSNWYVPLAVGATAWGVAAALPGWGYGYGYHYENPYYVAPVGVTQPAYDYSQPIAINTYETPSAEGGAVEEQRAPQPPPAAYTTFDEARAAFKRGDYRRAAQLVERAIQSAPNDSVLHEFDALCWFAMKDYQRAAAILNSLLAVAPGMDWTTMSSLYPDVDVYTQQLRALESHCTQKPDDAAARFVLAYHYLVAGHSDEAIASLKRVVALQPGDSVARRMLDAMVPAAQATSASPPVPATDGEEPSDKSPPATDLVGNWRADRNGDTFELSIDEQGNFTWKATPKGKPPVEITGTVLVTNDLLVLESKDQGSMVGRVASGGADQFRFVSTNGPPQDEGLAFRRI